MLSQTQGEGIEHQQSGRAESGADETRRIRSKHRQNDDETKQSQSPSSRRKNQNLSLKRSIDLDSTKKKNETLVLSGLRLQLILEKASLPTLFNSSEWRRTKLGFKIENTMPKSIVIKEENVLYFFYYINQFKCLSYYSYICCEFQGELSFKLNSL